MAHNDAADGFLPPILEPLLDRLAESLPPSVYEVAVGLLSHSFAAITAIVRLCASFLNRNPSEWTAEALLPPIITILAAYLALSSMYRTASWAIRLTFFFVKWGSLIGIIMAFAGYIAANGGAAVGNQQAGLNQALGGLFSSLLGGETSPQRKRQSRPKYPSKQGKAKAQSQGWQYQEQGTGSGNPEAQQLMDSIVDAAGKVMGGDWWGAVSSFGQGNNQDAGKKHAQKEGRGRVGKSRSR
ncbi:hypothetical protein CPB83DRAFT_852972 [Crepidotus variabilis]|uniref:Uncharacterized protein n=1 Tax=Crepidotus variabilis TaxID=179855 RepID=A0A9P6EIG5_9AGAR|nr:hypothetical protein CPB83DRAFT_852972 [Crepidotus variabilis]